MLSVCEGEEAFFDTTDHFMLEESVVVKETQDYDIWLKEPQSVGERRNMFLSRMGFDERSSCEVDEIESIDESLLSERRKSNSEANCSIHYPEQDWLDSLSIDVEEVMDEKLLSIEQCVGDGSAISKNKKTKLMSWLRSLSQKMMKNHSTNVSKESTLLVKAGRMIRMRTEQNRKSCMECTAIYAGQVLKAHDGLIWTMKFSPDGQYLASGGEDGVVCIWRITMVDTPCSADECCYGSPDMEGKPRNNKSSRASIVIPDKMFHIEEAPFQRLKGHRGNVLDLAWSTSNHLLSSSTDNTIRLWQADCDKCLGVFHHSNYVTCVQFNPTDEGHFISGCIDGKVRIWSIHSKRVEEWANVQDIVTAVCYQPNGTGFVVGSLSGNCRFYESSDADNELILNAEINFKGRNKSYDNKITGIQFMNNDSGRMMISSEDSKIRILDGLEVVHKYKGLTKSGSQMSASFTLSGRHIVSIGEDSRVYVWNYDDPCIPISKQAKSTRSCESFLSEGASVVLTWSDTVVGDDSFASCTCPTEQSERFSLANWFSMDASSRGSATWPEERLPPSMENQPCTACGDHFHYHQQQQETSNGGGFRTRSLSSTWGLVFVTANWDGTIRMFHNCGLPVKV